MEEWVVWCLAGGLFIGAIWLTMYFWYKPKKMRSQYSAMKFIERAIKDGRLTRVDQCEVCTSKPIGYKAHAIVAHHWNGYDDPLNIWWICRSCNRFLASRHDGSLNLEQAKLYVRRLQRARLGYLEGTVIE